MTMRNPQMLDAPFSRFVVPTPRETGRATASAERSAGGGILTSLPRPVVTVDPRVARLEEENRALKAELEQLKRLALHDELTGLFNRRYFDQRLSAELGRMARFGCDVSVMLVDVDDFKRVNDRWGHAKGDEVLVWVAELLRSQLRSIDVPCRVGGDEFAVVLPETAEAGALLCAERLRQVVGEAGRGARHRVKLSFGTASTRGGKGSREVLMAEADQAMYRDKFRRGAGRRR